MLDQRNTPGRVVGFRGARGWLRGVLVVVSLTLSLTAAEIGLRWADFGDTRPGEYSVGAAGLPAPRHRGGLVEDARLGMTYTVDEDGFRTLPSGPEIQQGAPLVAFLGDSFVFGVCVEDTHTLPRFVASEMADRGTAVNVVNWGVSGANTHQQAMVARQQLARVQPAVLVLVVIENDAEVTPWNPDPLHECGLESTSTDRVGRWLLDHVYLHRLAASALFPCTGPRRCGRYRFDNDWPTGRCFAASFSAILTDSRAAGAEVLVVYFPQVTREPRSRSHPEAARADVIAGMAFDAGVHFVSLVELFSDRDPADVSCERPDGTRERHPSPQGHRIAAQPIAEELLAILDGT